MAADASERHETTVANPLRSLRIGHATSTDGSTGVTVARFPISAPTVVRVSGGVSTTYDTGSLALDATFGGRWAIFFSGGSLFGLDAARGIRTALLSDGDGHRVFGHPQLLAPISGATLFDLPDVDRDLPDYAALGRIATDAAVSGSVPIGRLGAGAGATIGKYLGRGHASAGGVGFASVRAAGIGHVVALAVVNAVGAVRDPGTSRWVSGARRGGKVVPPRADEFRRSPGAGPRGTTLGLLVTDAAADRRELQRALEIASAGLARSIEPVFTATDGDVLFFSTLGQRTSARPTVPGELADRLGAIGAEALARAIVSAVEPRRRAAPHRSRRRRSRR